MSTPLRRFGLMAAFAEFSLLPELLASVPSAPGTDPPDSWRTILDSHGYNVGHMEDDERPPGTGLTEFMVGDAWAASDESGGSSDDCNTEEWAEDCESEDDDGDETATKSAKNSRHGTTQRDVDCEVIECITVTAPRPHCPVGAICITGGFNFLLDLNTYYVDPSPPDGGGGGTPEPEVEPEDEEPDSVDCWSDITGNSNAEISGEFNEVRTDDSLHKGIDFEVVTGTGVHAPRDGVVHSVISNLAARSTANERGNHVSINFDGGESGRLLHLKQESVTVTAGERVTAGQLVAQSNETGSDITGPHLHYDHNTGAIATGATNGSGSYVNPKLEFANCEEADD